MENASKALLIAAAVLVAILVITIGIKIFSSSSDTGKVATDTGKTISDKTGEATGLAISGIKGKSASNAINYGSKTKETIEPGDDITIGGTEKFKVFSVGTDGIKAMPYYNLNLDSNPMRQATEQEARNYQGGAVVFADTSYWIGSESEDINMKERNENNRYKNNVQQYIDAYERTLVNLKVFNFEVRAVKYSEIKDIDGKYMYPSGSKGPCYWTGSYYKYNSRSYKHVYYVRGQGDISTPFNGSNFNWDGGGVRPILILKK